jgi:GNAT superfamily N-acetyltransferase
MERVTIRPYHPTDNDQLDDLVVAHAATDPTYAPPDGVPGNAWLSGGVGACLMRFVAEIDGTVVGHVAVGSIPPCPQRDLWITYLKKNYELVEIRRGMVHPHLIGTGVGGALTKTAVRWALERKCLPVAASVTGRTNSVEMMRNYGWESCGVLDVENYGPVTLWAPPTSIINRV